MQVLERVPRMSKTAAIGFFSAVKIERAASFGAFRLLPGRRLLLHADKPVRLGSRALDILIALVERAGELVTKDELMARVWPNTFVEPANLSVHVAALRRTLGDGHDGNRFLINIPGRGYQFVEPVKFTDDLPGPVPTAAEQGDEPTPHPTDHTGTYETDHSLLNVR
jgi:DNA-binding winged helix-turn-helix (wHTH) protein